MNLERRVLASVIIPTLDRGPALDAALRSINLQSMSRHAFEVIVVDDGSSRLQLESIVSDFDLPIRLIRQEHRGATAARNLGASKSQGDILVFMDDDVTLSPDTLQQLVEACLKEKEAIVLADIISRPPRVESIFARITQSSRRKNSTSKSIVRVPFTDCNTQLLAVRKSDFVQIGMLEDPGGGWPNWDDVDLGYRADQLGFRIVKCLAAKAIHWDYSLSNLRICCERWRNASKASVKLIRKHPMVIGHLGMFRDKEPIDWKADPPSLAFRKILRSVSASEFVLRLMTFATGALERSYPEPQLLRPLYRWIIGSHIFIGFRDGLTETPKSIETSSLR